MRYFKLIEHPDSYRELWENREALDKYLTRLKELMEEDENKEAAALDLESTKPVPAN